MQKVDVQGSFYSFHIAPNRDSTTRDYAIVHLRDPYQTFEMKGSRYELAEWFSLLARLLSP